MKQMRMICLIFVAITLLQVSTGCDGGPFTYEFRQARSNVEKVEICSYDHYEGTREVLVRLEEADVDALLADIQALPLYKRMAFDTPRDYGDVVIFISYLDGVVELIGLTNFGWIDPDGTQHNLSAKYFEMDDLYLVLVKYVDPDVLSEVSYYF